MTFISGYFARRQAIRGIIHLPFRIGRDSAPGEVRPIMITMMFSYSPAFSLSDETIRQANDHVLINLFQCRDWNPEFAIEI